MAVIDVQTGVALNNLYHAGWPRGPRWAPVCLWVVPPTHTEILLCLMGQTEGLDCQHSASSHFSFQVSKVHPCTPATPSLPVLPSSVNGDWVSWNMEAWKRVSIIISFPDKSFFLPTKTLDNLFLMPLFHNARGTGFVFLLKFKCENGLDGHVHKLWQFLGALYTHTERQREKRRKREIGTMHLSH